MFLFCSSRGIGGDVGGVGQVGASSAAGGGEGGSFLVATAAADKALVMTPLATEGPGARVGFGAEAARLPLEHAGAEALALRGDGRLWAAAGWDRRVGHYFF